MYIYTLHNVGDFKIFKSSDMAILRGDKVYVNPYRLSRTPEED